MNLKQKSSLAIMLVFIVVATFGVAVTAPFHHHEPGCPFMVGEQSICPMGLFGHIRAWQSVFTVLVPSLFSLIVALYLMLILWFITHPPDLWSFYSKRPEQRKLSFSCLYQELYSAGILNPKAP